MAVSIKPNPDPKILLVDDREDNLRSMEAILKPGGYQFHQATSGKEALRILLDDTDFALILMDVKMPVMDGYETASLIYEREKLQHIPIMFITAINYGDEHAFKGYQSGGIDYIFKPLNPEVLCVKVALFARYYKRNKEWQEREKKLIEINDMLREEIRVLKENQMKDSGT
jgi:CheY-like chemotaxis protein